MTLILFPSTKILYLHPEGTRSSDGTLLPFKSGVGILAKEMDVLVVPVAIKGGFEIFPNRNYTPNLFCWREFRRYPLQIIFGEPISIAGEIEKGTLDPDSPFLAEEFTTILRNHVQELLAA